MFNIHSLKFKIVSILFASMAVLLVCQALFIGPHLQATHLEHSLKMQTALADQIANEFERSFQQAVKELEELAKSPGIVSPDKAKNDATIAMMDKITPFFNYFFLMDKQGQWLSFPTRPRFIGKHVPEKNMGWVNKTFHENQTIFLNVVVATVAELVSGFSTPVPADTGKPDRLLRGVFVLSEKNVLLSTIKNIKVGENGYAFLVAENGWVLAHPDIQQSAEKFTVYDYKIFPPVKEVMQGRKGHLEYEYNNTRWLASYRPITTTGWGVIVQQPVADIYRPIEKDTALTKWFFILSFILTMSILVIIIPRTLKPLSRLAQSIADGNVEPTARYSKDEVGLLAAHFNDLFIQLNTSLTAHRKSEKKLVKYQENLEDLVKTRTENLKTEILERQQVEEALRTNEEKLSLLIAQSPLGIISWDMHFNVTKWSHAAEIIFNYPCKEALGKHATFIIPPSDREHVEKIWENLIENRGGYRSTNTNITKDGRTILCDWYNTPLLDASGTVVGVLSIVDDVTDKRRMETELFKVRKLESLGMFAGGIAHDFNNILTGILGNINLSLLDKSLEDQTRERLLKAEKASDQAAALTQQLLTFAKGGDPVRERASLHNVVTDAANLALHGDSAMGCYDIPEDLWCADIDKNQISRVIQNIVLNASQSMPDGGTINIACENVDTSQRSDLPLPENRTFVKVTITDSGTGIPENVINKIFDPYFSTKEEGSGLGLAIAHSIISKHDGYIFVQSELDRGTSFIIYLPALPCEMVVEQKNEETDGLVQKAKILVMDDEEIVRGVAETMLTEMGHIAVGVGDGLEAVQQYKEAAESGAPFDLVIMDLTIAGGMGGEEAVQQILALDPGAKVIVSSGYSKNSIMASYRDYGFCGALSKPYTMRELSGAVQLVQREAKPMKDDVVS